MTKDKLIGIVWYGSVILLLLIIAGLVAVEVLEKVMSWL